MSSQGGGKARDKRSHRNKPYERRQSLLGRLTGTVTRLLPEAWVPAWLQEEEDAPEQRPGPATRRNHLNAIPIDTWNSQPAASAAQLREDEDGRLMADAGGGPGLVPRAAPSDVTGGPGLVPRTSAGPSWSRPAPTAAEDGPVSAAWPPAAAPAGPSLDESLARKRRRRQLQRDDDSELSDDSGPPASAPAAPAPAPAQTFSSAAAASSGRARPQPAALSSKRPRFNASALNTSLMSQDGSVNTSLNRSGAGQSPFYPGPTVYGGAANHRRLRVPRAGSGSSSHGPYQVRPRAVSTRASEEASMSTTARRILSVLEGMSTPVTDARRVPLTSPGDRLLNCSLDGQRRAGLYGAHGARLGRRRTEDPPVHHVVSPVKVAVEPNRSLSAAPTEEAVGSRRVTFSNQPTSSAAAAAPSAPTPSTSTGGKMRRQKERGHYSSRPETDPGELPPSPEPLPDVSLPFMHIKPISLATSTPKVPPAEVVRRSVAVAAEESEETGEFVFSRPTEVCAAGSGLVNGLDEGEEELVFEFSAPEAVGERSAAPAAGSSGSGSARVDKADPVPLKSSTAPAAPVTSSSGDKVKDSPAANTDTKAAAPAVTSSWGDKFKPAAGQWTCDTCMISNKADDAKCIACETPNASAKSAPAAASGSKLSAAAEPFVPASSWGDKFKPPSGQWTCDTCMLSNKAEAAKCVACETPNPSPSSAASAAPKSADWECSTCLIRNKPAVSKCAACQSPRLESREKDSTPYQFGASKPAAGAFSFGFGAKKSDGEAPKSSAGGFVFGADSSTTSESNSDDKKTSSGSGFNFGVKNSDKLATNAAFAFGFGTGSSAAAKDSASPKTSEPAPKAPAVNFGAGSGSSPSLKRKQSDRPAEKPVPELKTGNIMDLLGGGSANVAKSADTNNVSSKEEGKTSSKSTALPTNGGFSFGAAPATTGSATFSFGSGSQAATSGTATISSGESAAKKPSEPAKSEASDGNDKPPALFSFGSKSSGTADKPSAGFTFGAGSGTVVTDGVAKETKTTSAGFTFGETKTAGQSDKKAAAFTFGAKTSESATQPTAVFAFGANPKPSDSTEKPPAAGFSFGAKAPENTDKPSATFTFGSGTKPADKPPATFSFGSKAPESSDKPAVFAFGSTPASSASTTSAAASAGFSFGTVSSSSSSADKPASGGFTFGTPAATKAESTPAFSFGATSNGPAAKKAAAEDKPAAPAAVFQFGSGSAAPATAAPFGAAAPTPAAPATFNFGAAKTTAAPATFNFGSSAAAPAATSAPAPFAFGSSQPAPAAAPAAPAPGVFAFGQSGSQPAAAPAFGAPAFGQSAPAAPSAGFSFGASSTPSFNFSSGQQAAPAAAPADGVFRFGAPSDGAPAAAAPTPAPAPFGAAAQAPGAAAANPFSAPASTLAGRVIRTAKRRTIRK